MVNCFCSLFGFIFLSSLNFFLNALFPMLFKKSIKFHVFLISPLINVQYYNFWKTPYRWWKVSDPYMTWLTKKWRWIPQSENRLYLMVWLFPLFFLWGKMPRKDSWKLGIWNVGRTISFLPPTLNQVTIFIDVVFITIQTWQKTWH